MSIRPSIICAASLFAAIFLNSQPLSGQTELGLRTVVIDAGHGGKDPGCISRDKKTQEKKIALDVSKALQKKIQTAFPEVKAELTRSGDTFVELDQRAKFATKAGAQLFISIHVNAQDGKTNATGASVHILGQSQTSNRDTYELNREVVRRENSVILLEDDRTAYQGLGDNDPETAIFLNLMANAHRELSLSFASKVVDRFKTQGPIRTSLGVHQDNFAVLRLASMPAALIELGFISNPSDLAKLRDEKNIDVFAQAIFDAFADYKKEYDASLGINTSSKPENNAVKESEKRSENEVKNTTENTPYDKDFFYGIQIFASAKDIKENDPRFLGYQQVRIQSGKVWKYIINPTSDLESLKKLIPSVRNTYGDAFIVEVKDGQASLHR